MAKIQPMFMREHLELIRRALEDDAAFNVLQGWLGRLERVIRRAMRKRCERFHCAISLGGVSLDLRFDGPAGARCTASLPLKKPYERHGGIFEHETGLVLKVAVESLVVSSSGIRPAR